MDKLVAGKQLYLDESPEQDETKMVSYHIVDIGTFVDEDGNQRECLCLLRDSVVEIDMAFSETVSETEYPDYEGCIVDTYLSGEFLTRFKPDIRNKFVTVPIRLAVLKTKNYREINRVCYVPSACELFGITELRDIVDGDTVFDRQSYERGIGTPYWTRTPSSVRTAVMANEYGIESNRYVLKNCGVRPILWIDRKYFEGDYVEDSNEYGGVSFDIMYSLNIKDTKDVKETDLDTSVYDNEFFNNSVQKPVEYSMSKFTPRELLGFAKVGRNLVFENHILTPDYEISNGGMFYSFYIDNRQALIYGVSVDNNRIICKYVYRYLDSDVSVNVDDGNISEYSPEQLLDFADKGMQLKYFNDDLHLLKYNKPSSNTRSRSLPKSSVDFLEFSEQDGKIYKVNIDSDGNIDRQSYRNLISSYELCETGGQVHECRYDTEFLFNACNDDYTQITYNGNILYTDKLRTNTAEYNGYFFDEFDTAIYRINVQKTSGSSGYYKITRNLHKRIIKTVEIDGTDSEGLYTIQGIVDRSDYFIKNVDTLTIVYPGEFDGGVYTGEHFDMWITVSGTSSGTLVQFPAGTKFVKNQKFGKVGDEQSTGKLITNGNVREISIKDGVVVSMPDGEEWLDFD